MTTHNKIGTQMRDEYALTREENTECPFREQLTRSVIGIYRNCIQSMSRGRERKREREKGMYKSENRMRGCEHRKFRLDLYVSTHSGITLISDILGREVIVSSLATTCSS